MDVREEKGLVIAATSKIEKNQLGMWKVPSQSGNGTSYVVSLDHGHPFCSCPDFEKGNVCKHIHAVEFVVKRESKPDGSTIVTKSVTMSCTQEWPAYDAAQMHEQERFVVLLRDLCNGIPQPEYKFGRPRLPLADVVFGVAYKAYTTMSGRRFMSDLREAATKELVVKAPSFASNARYLENPELTPLLKTLIEQSAGPLKAVEADFAVDSSGFATSTYNRWFDMKYGKQHTKQAYVKVHVMCGVKTHIVTSVECSPKETADTVELIPMLNKTAETFEISEVSADKAYSSRANLHAIQSMGATPYIPFKGNAKGNGSRTTGYDSLWHRMWHFYNFNQEAFMAHYHKRSNVETVFSMIKTKFGSSVRAKTQIAQVNEVLCKVLCHNICVLIQSIYELGLEPTFWTSDTKKAIVPKVLENAGF